ncbi:MAG: hypothetical protein DWQ44_04915 [Bacteroidetes bacterium]|nr:MAG: hypothetical protein DWQ33_10875 [Bacteroidota bacterium]REK00593.1 MAG: hypothetical protein DWQ39_10550 [Bacteroidota bacterium]REK35285.1 MAG: hypothetical protein DWQ44_04915 [Bacteroidota bacterium]REK48361.1 MAG: hypothetical protein DWQ48_11115 [Bacteroidota bacterium]
MTIESLQQKLENQKRYIAQLTEENEELYHQFNHLMIRNTKLLKRVDDLQKIIDDLHIRIEELQLINGNMMQLNDNLRKRTENAIKTGSDIQKIHGVISNAYNDDIKYFSTLANIQDPADQFDLDDLFDRWKNYPGQQSQNAPNLRKQVLMMVHLYNNKSLRASDLFNLTGVGGVTGARYVSTLKKHGLIQYTGARKKGHYQITQSGRDFIEGKNQPQKSPLTRDLEVSNAMPHGRKDPLVHTATEGESFHMSEDL